MSFEKSAFRVAFPEFTSTDTYPDVMLDYWSGIARLQVNEIRFGDLYGHGVYLFVAHNCVLQAQSVSASDGGGTPGQQSGAIASKSVGSASISYDTASTMLPNAGHWNSTQYGRMFAQLMRTIGCGGMVV